jgi:hypothetical protein
MLKKLFLISLSFLILSGVSAQAWKNKLKEAKDKVIETANGVEVVVCPKKK